MDLIPIAMRKAALLLLLAGVACACVSNKKFNSMKAEALRLDGELNSANTRIDDLTRRNDTLTAKNLRLVSDSTRLYMSYTALQERYQKLLADGSAETARMLKELETSQMALNERSRRVNELEAMLRSREEAINAIRRKVTDALTGFDGKGLSISIKNGNVYVSMDDKLLFRSGSFEIDPNGARAVHDLATVLAQNPDINVMVEGHTDDVPYRPNGQLRDNLDLSAKRATTVVRLLLENKGIAPHHRRRTRRVAAGSFGQNIRGSREKPTHRNHPHPETRRTDAADAGAEITG